MRVDFAFLAEYASINPDGRINMVGGDLVTVAYPSFPVVMPVISLVLKLEFTNEEVESDQDFVLRLEAVGPDEQPISPPAGATIRPQGQRRDQVPGSAALAPSLGFATTFIRLTLRRSGAYWFRIIVNGEELRRLPLLVLQHDLPPETPPPESEISTPKGSDSDVVRRP